MAILGKLKIAGRIHLGLRAQILLLGVAGVIVVGAIYLIGLQIEDRSQQTADRFATLESMTARVSEGLLQAREMATEFLRKPDARKIAAHDELVKVAVGQLQDSDRDRDRVAGRRSPAAVAFISSCHHQLHHPFLQRGLGAEADWPQRE